MSNIKIVHTVDKSEVTFENNSRVGYCDFIFLLNRQGKVVDLKGFNFRLKVKIDEEFVIDKSYPPKNIKYTTVDQDVLISERVRPFPADSLCYVSVEISSEENKVSNEFDFIIQRPNQPYPSWEWIDNKWVPPTPYPGGLAFVWDEENNQWIDSPEEVEIIELSDGEVEKWRQTASLTRRKFMLAYKRFPWGEGTLKQAIESLLQTFLQSEIQAEVEMGEVMQESLAETTHFDRADQDLIGMATAIGMTPEQVDAFYIWAENEEWRNE